MRTTERRWLTTEEVMDYLQMSKATVRKLAGEANAAVRYGRTLRYDRQAIDEFLEKRKAPAATGTSHLEG